MYLISSYHDQQSNEQNLGAMCLFIYFIIPQYVCLFVCLSITMCFFRFAVL